jgi:hypothetical protein
MWWRSDKVILMETMDLIGQKFEPLFAMVRRLHSCGQFDMRRLRLMNGELALPKHSLSTMHLLSPQLE